MDFLHSGESSLQTLVLVLMERREALQPAGASRRIHSPSMSCSGRGRGRGLVRVAPTDG